MRGALCLCFMLAGTTHSFVVAPNKHARQHTRLHSEAVADGLVKTVTQPGRGVPVQLGDIATVKYSCYLPAEPKMAPFSKANQQKIVVGDGSMIQGWDKAIRTMNVGERAVVRISDPSLGYGDVGVPPLIPPGAEIEVDLEVLDSQPPMANIDFDNLAMADNTPVRCLRIIILLSCLRGHNMLHVYDIASPSIYFYREQQSRFPLLMKLDELSKH